MQYIVPNYYDDFSCIMDKCKHNCCVGWEIDIDEDTADFYKTVDGDFGKRLKNNIFWDDTPHFLLKQNERCPFLNESNLCDIILTLGEGSLCDICAEHPRFTNESPDRIEKGLGLCCEAAAELILNQKEPMRLLGDTNTQDPIILLRDKIILVLQERRFDINNRIEKMLKLCNTNIPQSNIVLWADRLLTLERLDSNWTSILELLKSDFTAQDILNFEQYTAERQTEYEQLAVYFIYRHFANSVSLADAAVKARFTAFSVALIKAIGTVIYKKTGQFDINTQIEISCMFSSEIEYSDENLYKIFNWLKK